MIYRSKAPLRIGLAGGGTDVSPYSDQFGGAILNATISLYANASIENNNSRTIHLVAADRFEQEQYPVQAFLPVTGSLDLLKAVYNRLQKEYPFETNGFTLTTSVDAPAGSGLGTSSTLVVAVLGAFVEMLKLPLGDYDIAHLAYDIERKDLQLAGGKQDQYAATFGGVNFMEFFEHDKVIVNPLRIRSEYLNELENNLVLFFTATSRESATIIKEQQLNVTEHNQSSIDAMHQLKEQAKQMKDALLKGNLNEIGEILNFGFTQKRKMARNISNALIEEIYEAAIHSGSTGGKISGAGGGGFMIFYCPGSSRYPVIKALEAFKGSVKNYSFTENGLTSWTIY
jgi:D-glycero-alpha-D-manno-heptose-7-phosphate kinase